MIDSYNTVSGYASAEIVVNKSRFIGYAVPCKDESEALAFLQSIREKHRTARHHCYAYIIGENGGVMRYSDDGEPGGTAGVPIMEVMRTKGIVCCCVVVVRYFGGILLGTGGLARAYTKAAQETIDSAGVVRIELTCVEYCELPYSVWDRFRYAAERLPVRIEQIEYGNTVVFQLKYRKKDEETVVPRLIEAAERKLESVPQEEIFTAWKIEK